MNWLSTWNNTFKQKAALHLVEEKKNVNLFVCTLPVSTVFCSQNRQSKIHILKNTGGPTWTNQWRPGGGGGWPPPYVALLCILEDAVWSSVLTHMLVGKCTSANSLEFVDELNDMKSFWGWSVVFESCSSLIRTYALALEATIAWLRLLLYAACPGT